MELHIPNVTVTYDGGYRCYDTILSALDISQALKGGYLRYDPEHQRGIKPGTKDKRVVRQAKIDQWAAELQEGTAIFGQLAWNFRPEENPHLQFVPDADDLMHGRLVVTAAQATMPDSYHRHAAIALAVDSAAKGSEFDTRRPFSVRLWPVPEAFEDVIFNAMNTEHDKADATRSKWLHQRGIGQKLAAGLVSGSQYLGTQNVQTISNAVSVRRNRLLSFNTLSSGFEDGTAGWNLEISEVEGAVAWLVKFWDALVQVVPSLGVLPLADRQGERRSGSLAASAMAIHGYVRLARHLYPNGDLDVLKKLPGLAADGQHDFFDIANPVYAERGCVTPGSGTKSTGKLVIRSSHASRRAMGEIFAERCGVAAS